MDQAALKIYKFPSSNENGANQVPIGGLLPKLVQTSSTSENRPARLKPTKSSVKSLASWFGIFNWLLSLFAGIVTPPTTTTTTTTTARPSTNTSYNYGCPYGQNGKYCDPCGISSAAVNIKIVGGVAATPHSYPAQAMIQFNYQNRVFNSAAGVYLLIDQTYMCGGTLINRNTVVTAAHCVPATVEYEYNGLTYEIPVATNSLKPTLGSMFTVFLGMEDISGVNLGLLKGGVQMSVSDVYKHPGFDEVKFQNDIAILKLSSEVVLSSDIQLACLPDLAQPGYPTQFGTDVYAVGWGTTSSGGSTSSLLNNVKLTYYNDSYCTSVLPTVPKNFSTQLCAGILAGGKDTCQGDSGGGIYMDGTINGTSKMIAAGIVSYGDQCGLVNKPGLYTRISAFLLWINQYA